MKKWKRRILVYAVGLVIVFGIRTYLIKKANNESKNNLSELLISLPSYPTEQTYIKDLFERSHRVAFQRSSSLRLGSVIAGFDQEKYLDELFGMMCSAAEMEGKKELAEEMATFKEILAYSN